MCCQIGNNGKKEIVTIRRLVSHGGGKHLNFSPRFNFSCTLRCCQIGNNGRCHNPPLGVSAVLDQTPHSWCNSRAAAGHALSSPQFFFFSLFSPPLSPRIQSVFSFSRQLLCTTNNQSFAPASSLRSLFVFVLFPKNNKTESSWYGHGQCVFCPSKMRIKWSVGCF